MFKCLKRNCFLFADGFFSFKKHGGGIFCWLLQTYKVTWSSSEAQWLAERRAVTVRRKRDIFKLQTAQKAKNIFGFPELVDIMGGKGISVSLNSLYTVLSVTHFALSLFCPLSSPHLFHILQPSITSFPPLSPSLWGKLRQGSSELCCTLGKCRNQVNLSVFWVSVRFWTKFAVFYKLL